jgi:outer membrane protease
VLRDVHIVVGLAIVLVTARSWSTRSQWQLQARGKTTLVAGATEEKYDCSRLVIVLWLLEAKMRQLELNHVICIS